ncbi:MAG: RnfABCDGE type electron transport complex subunit G [Flavobacteriaceae bacterium]|nr:RnfABCDGE type electron transport complex subunit G [Flavobacteriaceae bacterium]
MKKKESTFVNMLAALLIITVISGFSLGFVNDLTSGPKARARLERKIKALKLVLPAFTNNPVEQGITVKSDRAKDSVEIYPATENTELVGTAVIGSSDKGFSGTVKLMVGFKPEGTINNIVVLEQKETPGLGTKMKDDKFISQFRDKNPETFVLKVKKDGGDVDALTGATISSRAFDEAVQIAYDAFLASKDSVKISEKD